MLKTGIVLTFFLTRFFSCVKCYQRPPAPVINYAASEYWNWIDSTGTSKSPKKFMLLDNTS